MNLKEMIPVATAAAGGITNAIMDREFTWHKLLVATTTAGFAGYLVVLLSAEYNLSSNLTGVLCGISGLSGETALRIIKRVSLDYLKQKLEAKKGDKS